MTTNDRPTVTDEMLEAFRAANPLGGYREALQSVLDLIADTAPSPDPRTDLAGYLGLTQAEAPTLEADRG